MPKQPYYVQPWLKQMYSYQNFSGGLNTVASNETLLNTELRDVKNLNFDSRGSMSRRGGMVKTLDAQSGTSQGYFRFYYNYEPDNNVGPVGGMLPPNGSNPYAAGWYTEFGASANYSYSNGVQTIKSLSTNDSSWVRDYVNRLGLGTYIQGINSGAYYIAIADMLSDGTAQPHIAVRDSRYGTDPELYDKIFDSDNNLNPPQTSWTPCYLVFKAYNGMKKGNIYINNDAPPLTATTLQVKNVRMYEITLDAYNAIVAGQYDNATLGTMYPYKDDHLDSVSRTDEILVQGGKFYINGTLNNSLTIQSDRFIEGVQYNNVMYFATGSGLISWDGSALIKVEAYKPDPLEILDVGYNALAANPYDYMQDGTGTALQVLGVTFSKRTGFVNQGSKMTAFSDIPSGMTVEYQFAIKGPSDTDYVVKQAWSTTKTYTFKPTEEGTFKLKISGRPQGDTATTDQSDYYVSSYTVARSDTGQNDIDNLTMSNCNRILLHWDRLILYGDTEKPEVVYISHLENPGYFPMNNTLTFENPKNEGLTAITHYRDMLIAFTQTSIQTLTGKDPTTYSRNVLNTKIGCIAPLSTAIVDNYVFFLSYEGVYLLKSLVISNDMANVQKIDINVSNIIPQDINACACSFENQYQIVFPSTKQRFRYYYLYGTWTKDESDKLDLAQLSVYDSELYTLGNDGAVYRFDDSVYDDDGYIYEDYFETKGYDFGMPYNPKKLKELQVLVAHFNETANLKVEAYADDAIVLTTDQSYASIDSNGNVIWNTVDNPNLVVDAGTIFGQWDFGRSTFGHVDRSVEKFKLNGKCYYTKITVSHTEANQNQFLGLGYVFKVKKPK